MIASAAISTSHIRHIAPQCLPLSLSDVAGGERRLDAEVYMSEGSAVRRAISLCGLRVSPLRELAKIWQPLRLKGIQVGERHGTPFLTATQVFDTWPTPRKWLAPDKTPGLAQRYVTPGWILVTCSGTVGNVIMSYSAHKDLIISHDLLRVDVEEPELRSYIYTFLRSRFGRTMMRSSQYGNVVKHLEVAHLEKLPVPLVNRPSLKLHERITQATQDRDEAYRLDLRARQWLADALDDAPDRLSDDGYVVHASTLFHGRRRLEATAYSPACQLVAGIYERNAARVDPLMNSCEVVLPSRFRRIYGEKGTPYLDSEPIFKVNPEITKYLTPATRISFDEYMVRRGWLLMARSGQVYGINGQTILADAFHEGTVVSEHVIRLIPNGEIRPGYLQTVLSHPVLGKPLVVSRAYGTSVPELAPEDIEQLPIPRLGEHVENQIADAAERASTLRVNAANSESAAVSRLERELEQHLGI